MKNDSASASRLGRLADETNLHKQTKLHLCTNTRNFQDNNYYNSSKKMCGF